MRRYILIAAAVPLLFKCSMRPTTDAKQPSDIVFAPQVLPSLWRMLEDAGLGARRGEESAFIVVHDGKLTLIRWPECGEIDRARWYGSLPDGAIAIVHTHPNWLPLPSMIDIRTSRRSHLPVYVVTRTRISKTVGGEPQVILNGDWNPVRIPYAR